jgi:uncharacterized protein with beta-barrel porin domain
VVYDQTFNAAFGDPVVQAGVTAARAAITTAGGPGVAIFGPNLVSRTETLLSSNTTSLFTLNRTETSVTTSSSLGPGTIMIGGTNPPCPSIAALPSSTRPTGCPGQTTTFFVNPGTTNFNTNTHYQYFVDEAATTSNTFRIFEVYELLGTVQSVGTVHTATIAGAYDMAQRFLRRLGDESDFDDTGVLNGDGGALGFAPSGPRADLPPELMAYAAMPTKGLPYQAPPATRYRAWMEGYGIWSRTSAQGAIPGNDRRMYGLAGGFSYQVTPNWRLGFGVDQGWQNVDLDAVSESAKIDMTQVGVHAAYRSRPWLANVAAVFGFGGVNASHGNLGLGGTAAASYDVRMWGVLGEVGRRFMFGDVRVIPKVGFDWIGVHTDGFTETGGLALVVGSHSAERARLWGGAEVGRRFASGASVIDLSAYGRLVGVVSGDQVLLPVAFAGAPGVPLTISGTRENDLGIDAGAKASIAVSRNALIYAAYDGRFRDGYEAHAASGGIKVRW